MLALAQVADHAGLETAYVADHFLPVGPVGAAAAGPILEAWTTLSALAVSTRQLRLGTLVLGNAYRHPAVVASMAATLDQVSGGRVTLGLGAGWQENEHAAFGIDLAPARERLDRFEEAVRVIQALLRDDVTTFEGAHYRISGARCEPRPVQDPLPVLVGGGGERRTIPLAARYAQAWHTWTQPTEFRRKSAVLDRACEAVGRDPADVRRVSGQTVLVSSNGSFEADDEDVVGTADQVVSGLAEYREAGVDEFVVRDHVDIVIADALVSLRALGDDVAPHLG
jgi:F420-dependent oxidoreductase-like protein